MPTEIQSAYGGLLSSFVNALWSLVDPHEMTIDPDAVEMLLDFHDEIEPRLAKEGDLRPLGGFVGKIVGSAARFAALHHLGWYGPRGLPLPMTVGSGSPQHQAGAVRHRALPLRDGGDRFRHPDRHRGSNRPVVPPRPAVGVHQEGGPARSPHLASGRDGGAAATAGGQRLREVGRSAARGAHRAQAIRRVPREPSRLAAGFCQFCRASTVRRCVVSTGFGRFCRFCRSVTTQIKAILSRDWSVGLSL